MREAKLFDSHGFVVTTERFVYGSKVVPLAEITIAMANIIRGWAALIIAVIGIGLVVWGGVLLKILGLGLLPVAYLVFIRMTERLVVVATKDGKFMEFKVETTELLENVVGAINNALRDRQRAHAANLRAELDSLPSVR